MVHSHESIRSLQERQHWKHQHIRWRLMWWKELKYQTDVWSVCALFVFSEHKKKIVWSVIRNSQREKLRCFKKKKSSQVYFRSMSYVYWGLGLRKGCFVCDSSIGGRVEYVYHHALSTPSLCAPRLHLCIRFWLWKGWCMGPVDHEMHSNTVWDEKH